MMLLWRALTNGCGIRADLRVVNLAAIFRMRKTLKAAIIARILCAMS